MVQPIRGNDQLFLDGFGTLLQSRAEPEDVLERARALGHVTLVLAAALVRPANENGDEPSPAVGRAPGADVGSNSR